MVKIRVIITKNDRYIIVYHFFYDIINNRGML